MLATYVMLYYFIIDIEKYFEILVLFFSFNKQFYIVISIVKLSIT